MTRLWPMIARLPPLCFVLAACSPESSTIASPMDDLSPGQPGAALSGAPGDTASLPSGSSAPTPPGASPPGASVPVPGAEPSSPGAVPSSPSDGAPSNPGCVGDVAIAPKRIVRLTFNQIANSIRDLLGDALADDVAQRYELPSAYERTFPPLNNPREGSVIIDSQWQTGDAIAQDAGRYVADNFTSVTGCGDSPTMDCARGYLDGFAEAAYRRPLTDEERVSLSVVFDGVVTAGGTPQEATQYGVYAALSAPQFLYRTEFGADSLADGALSQYEIASMLSYFVTDGPPDAELYDAASRGELATPEVIASHVDRMLQTPEAKENLQSAMFSYFGISTLETIVIDPEVAMQFNEGLRASMMRETELFINNTLWSGTVQDLLLSRTSYINEGVANLYGIDFPPPGVNPDQDGFAQVTLPDNRSGILTQPGYLTTRSSPEEPSVVRRGLLVNASLLCATNPPFPEAQAEAIEEVSASIADLTQREQAEFRATTTDCAGCHLLFDAYGLALDNFDVIGAYREVDEHERPIDASVTLPSAAGGATVTTPAQMAEEIVNSGAFTRCVSKNLLSYALAEGSTIATTSCATKAVTEGFAATDQSFGALIREVAKSPTFIARSAGASQ